MKTLVRGTRSLERSCIAPPPSPSSIPASSPPPPPPPPLPPPPVLRRPARRVPRPPGPIGASERRGGVFMGVLTERVDCGEAAQALMVVVAPVSPGRRDITAIGAGGRVVPAPVTATDPLATRELTSVMRRARGGEPLCGVVTPPFGRSVATCPACAAVCGLATICSPANGIAARAGVRWMAAVEQEAVEVISLACSDSSL